jgi:hypothetical protein
MTHVRPPPAAVFRYIVKHITRQWKVKGSVARVGPGRRVTGHIGQLAEESIVTGHAGFDSGIIDRATNRFSIYLMA